jgi:hypothetical protein
MNVVGLTSISLSDVPEIVARLAAELLINGVAHNTLRKIQG